MQTNSPPKLDTYKKIKKFSPFQKQFQLPLNKTNRIPTYSHMSSKSSPFCHVLTKTTQTKSKQIQVKQSSLQGSKNVQVVLKQVSSCIFRSFDLKVDP